jgi:hypothetical protein
MAVHSPRVVERRKKILELRAERKTYKQMAALLGVSETLIKQDIRALLREDQRRRERPPDTDLEARRWKAWEARKSGMTLVQVAETCGVSRNVATQDLGWCQKQLLDAPTEAARKLDLERLDRVINANWPQMEAGNDKSARVILRCLERRAQIYGYDAPKKIDATIQEVDPADLELRQIVNEAKAKAAAQEQQILRSLEAGQA